MVLENALLSSIYLISHTNEGGVGMHQNKKRIKLSAAVTIRSHETTGCREDEWHQRKQESSESRCSQVMDTMITTTEKRQPKLLMIQQALNLREAAPCVIHDEKR